MYFIKPQTMLTFPKKWIIKTPHEPSPLRRMGGAGSVKYRRYNRFKLLLKFVCSINDRYDIYHNK